jgi:hypothetical protein
MSSDMISILIQRHNISFIIEPQTSRSLCSFRNVVKFSLLAVTVAAARLVVTVVGHFVGLARREDGSASMKVAL